MVVTKKKAPPKPRQRKHKPDSWRGIFIEALRQSGNVRFAAQSAKVSRVAAYKARDTFPEFAAEWDSALEDATDHLEKVARERALDTSDTLMIFLLKAHRPEKFRETLNVKVEDLRELSDEQLAAMARR